ncbi:MAG: 5-(carboxyamino)imidazole ribonucleotide synthase [Rhodospirillales bacterium]|nr:5-(carboxyamino)imidazole ribonucleotide synthase [Rhodospirillales bacterium]MCB9995476.1 5-(carboxyamino)imidazole ribonucleotide synthase [Rhodospirillales bacterium]
MRLETKILGILGGGQLGRMSALAAARLGVKTHIYCPEEDSPASHVAAKTFIGEYEDKRKLKAFAESVDVISYEFENIPVETVRYLQQFRPVCPDDRLLEMAQDRGKEKQFLNDIGIPTARWALAHSAEEIQTMTNDMGCSGFILKTTRFGYDGKGQVSYDLGEDPTPKWQKLDSNEIIIEEKVDFACEISVIVARDKLAQIATYGPILNEHDNHILSKSTVPAPIPDHTAAEARRITEHLAEAVDLVGVLALEMFVTPDGRLLANEIAPRTHNSGHWTIDACTVSQFEQHVRTACGMPIGHPNRHSDAVMINLIGGDAKKLAPWLEMKGASLHLYGKDDIREGRKMGHVTVLRPKVAGDIDHG